MVFVEVGWLGERFILRNPIVAVVCLCVIGFNTGGRCWHAAFARVRFGSTVWTINFHLSMNAMKVLACVRMYENCVSSMMPGL